MFNGKYINKINKEKQNEIKFLKIKNLFKSVKYKTALSVNAINNMANKHKTNHIVKIIAIIIMNLNS
jgi:hypothetical protein